MNFKDTIISITDKDPKKRFKKILDKITLPYYIQEDPVNDIKNIIIPSVSKNKIVVMAHWDVVSGSFGYNDNSTGVSVLLKLQEDLPRLLNHVELVFTDGEECGGMGSRLYAKNAVKPAFVVNVDVVGLGNTLFYEKYADDENIIPIVKSNRIQSYDNVPFSDSRILEMYRIPNVLLLSGYQKHTLISDIFKAQHNGPNDGDFSLIKESMINFTYNTIKKMVGYEVTYK